MLSARLFAPTTARQLVRARVALAALLGLRIALSPFPALAGQPAALFRPVSFLQVLDAMPSRPVIAGLQVAGAGAAGLVLARRWPRAAFAVAWLVLLVLAGLRSSLGKILHNDVLLLIGAFPLLFAPPVAESDLDRPARARYGWPLSVGLAAVSLSYFLAGVAKLRHSGLAWVASDNMGYVMAAAGHSGKPAWPEVAIWVSQQPWLTRAIAAGILGLELAFPVALLWPRTRPWFAALVAVLHAGTWVTLGLDYWLWIGTAAVLLLAGPHDPGRSAAGRRHPLVAVAPAAPDFQGHRDERHQDDEADHRQQELVDVGDGLPEGVAE